MWLTLVLVFSAVCTPFTATAQSTFLATVPAGSRSVAAECAAFNDNLDGSYWDEVKNCSSCAQHQGCGYCLSTLQCVEGDALGPLDGSPCPDWVSDNNQAALGEPRAVAASGHSCPVAPTCHEFTECGSCAQADDCAWCASEGTCLTVSDVFSQNCRGTVFDVPCPASFVGVNRVVGNLVVTQDPIFGGGDISVSGKAVNTGIGAGLLDGSGSGTATFHFTVNGSTAELASAQGVHLSGGNSGLTNAAGGFITLRAGDGNSVNRGAFVSWFCVLHSASVVVCVFPPTPLPHDTHDVIHLPSLVSPLTFISVA